MGWLFRRWLRYRFNSGGRFWAAKPPMAIFLSELRRAYPEDNLPTSRQALVEVIYELMEGE